MKMQIIAQINILFLPSEDYIFQKNMSSVFKII